jgi:hypothetical protein
VGAGRTRLPGNRSAGVRVVDRAGPAAGDSVAG